VNDNSRLWRRAWSVLATGLRAVTALSIVNGIRVRLRLTPRQPAHLHGSWSATVYARLFRTTDLSARTFSFLALNTIQPVRVRADPHSRSIPDPLARLTSEISLVTTIAYTPRLVVLPHF